MMQSALTNICLRNKKTIGLTVTTVTFLACLDTFAVLGVTVVTVVLWKFFQLLKKNKLTATFFLT